MRTAFVGPWVFAVAITAASVGVAQCPELPPDDCQVVSGTPLDYAITPGSPYWTVVAVVPTEPDDKDVALYTGCGATGSLLAASNGIDGTDFVIGDFNHMPYATLYPRIGYGSASSSFVVSWMRGAGEVFPVSQLRLVRLGGTGLGCENLAVFDVFLEAGVEYGFRCSNPGFDAYLALFRNPAAAPYWVGRSAHELELPGSNVTHTYFAPATDWYGVVVFPRWRQFTSGLVAVDVEQMHDCIPLVAGQCTSNVLYTVGAGPKDNYRFEQTTNFWAAVAVASAEGTHTNISMYTACDEEGEFLTSGGGYLGDSQVVVGDFNHTPMGTYFPVLTGYESSSHTIEWDSGDDMLLPSGDAFAGVLGGTAGECGLVRMVDVPLVANVEYDFSFVEQGAADVHVELFRNPTNDAYWTVNTLGEWSLSDAGHQLYVAPQSDWYGLAVWANRREVSGSFAVRLEARGDCIALQSGVCRYDQGQPRDYTQEGSGYWTVVGVLPQAGDDKDIYVYEGCDGEGAALAGSLFLDGADFVVADFNHIPAGSFHPRVTYGSAAAPYVVEADFGRDAEQDMLPIGVPVEVDVGGMDCSYFRVWDAFLEVGHVYRFEIGSTLASNVTMALFRNPGNGAFWAGRNRSEWEIVSPGAIDTYVSATDWYAVVVFADRTSERDHYVLNVHDVTGTPVPPAPVAPSRFALHANVPNPFNPATTIAYDVPAPGSVVTLRIYDAQGHRVRTLHEGFVSGGTRSVTWDARDDAGRTVTSGVYYCRMVAREFVQSRKLVVMK